ncbi:GntR family transcriptional regulator [Blautia sp. HCN-1074]|uniref:GntR family transcriptional regulator n=1 Tax=Blautia sp. HCN-1074 TaxID=3134667 RepID=UPI0011C3BC58
MRIVQVEMAEYKYKVVYDWIKEKIDNRVYKFGQKLPSENFLCTKFNISRQSVRKAYVALTMEDYVYSIHGSGYYVKRESTYGQSTKTVGIIMSYVANHMFPSILRGIEEVLLENGYGMHLGITENCFDRERKCLELLERDGISGIIVEGTKSALPNPNLHLYQRFIERGIPIVFIHNYYRELAVPSVLMDDIEMAREITMLLIKAGHVNIGCAFKYDDLQGHRRFQGFAEALNSAGIPVVDDHVKWFASKKELWTQNRYGISMETESIKDVTGYVCYNDMLAEEFVMEARKIAISIPQQLSMVAFDDQNVQLDDGHYLTSVRHPRKKLGIKAAETLLDIIEGNGHIENFEKIIVPSKISVRDSIIPVK